MSTTPPPGLSTAERFCWAVIDYDGRADRRTLRRRTAISPNTLDSALQTLVERDLVTTRPDPEDARRTIYEVQ
ncbi:MarR family winged helix-turn-helix transcriptional regulator [Halomarina oriensis]|uniref:MarR family transcriptional regulator n=1 Tax=Halomarina oriensis TaxID=671145 RepID=A0A6B0GV83_9EURY|nr:MarR family winged helix-turn-helix transcriptional regulator [Halomarina oriensis]MWG36493.1 MarR family transcriptional regulator [Halomarina oriensis]